MPKTQGNLMVVLQGVGLISMKRLGSRIGPLVKFLQSSKRLVIIGHLTLSLKREGALIHQLRRQLMKGMTRRTMVTALMGRTIVFVVLKVDTMFQIAQICRGMTTTMDNQAVRMWMLRITTTSMPSALEVSMRLLLIW